VVLSGETVGRALDDLAQMRAALEIAKVALRDVVLAVDGGDDVIGGTPEYRGCVSALDVIGRLAP
jgi:hypothetical protein